MSYYVHVIGLDDVHKCESLVAALRLQADYTQSALKLAERADEFAPATWANILSEEDYETTMRGAEEGAIADILDPMIEKERIRRNSGDAWEALRGAAYVDAYQTVRALLVGFPLAGPPSRRQIFRIEGPGLTPAELELGWLPGEAPASDGPEDKTETAPTYKAPEPREWPETAFDLSGGGFHLDAAGNVLGYSPPRKSASEIAHEFELEADKAEQEAP
jgi:hypothetical protein